MDLPARHLPPPSPLATRDCLAAARLTTAASASTTCRSPAPLVLGVEQAMRQTLPSSSRTTRPQRVQHRSLLSGGGGAQAQACYACQMRRGYTTRCQRTRWSWRPIQSACGCSCTTLTASRPRRPGRGLRPAPRSGRCWPCPLRGPTTCSPRSKCWSGCTRCEPYTL